MNATTYRVPGETFAGYTQLEAMTCPSCGILHAIPAHMAKELRRRSDGRDVYCPNGHTSGWSGKSEEQKLRERLERERGALEVARRERNEAESRTRSQRAAATRARNERDKDCRRVANGVCPCCSRTFKQLARHMETKHPDYVVEANQTEAKA